MTQSNGSKEPYLAGPGLTAAIQMFAGADGPYDKPPLCRRRRQRLDAPACRNGLADIPWDRARPCRC